MDILKKLLNNPAFDHLAENIISFMDTDEAMETMIESELLSDEERKVMRKMLRKLMIKEAQMYCEKEVEVGRSDPPIRMCRNNTLQNVSIFQRCFARAEKQRNSGKFQPIV